MKHQKSLLEKRLGLRGFIFVCFAASVLALFGCGKSNYLKVGENATVTAKEGLYIRADASAQSKKIGLVPTGQDFQVLAEGATESLYSIKSRWYKVSYRGKTGWLWGGLATPASTSATGRGYCIAEDDLCTTQICGAYAELKPDGTYRGESVGCGETGHVSGTWRQNDNVIEVDYTVYPQCYEQCGNVSPEKYTEAHKYSGHRTYRLLPNNKATYIDEVKGNREQSKRALNVTRL
ncbi:SH3 domain-containing protein [Turneriella parva]|uniref:SH3 type 3 domain protein n=1 Tax=Turneriella parva (strain ATCC BAA-1111 / DSM 21527 / NCTC 11395 / H) TaxID=869212 RepID=I4B0B8_TURPD|nr:SH3 domain-containing protein [Turneriella parva]AFM10725.1 SH3 type 3 domain protein [Turneriella parva DSM 21527]